MAGVICALPPPSFRVPCPALLILDARLAHVHRGNVAEYWRIKQNRYQASTAGKKEINSCDRAVASLSTADQVRNFVHPLDAALKPASDASLLVAAVAR